MITAYNRKQVNSYYQNRYQREKSRAMRPPEAYRIFFQYLKLKTGRLLDVACGTGYFLSQINKRNIKLYGIDFSTKAVSIARTNAPKAKISQSGAEKLPFENAFFDYLVCLGSLQYFPDMNLALAEMKRVARKKAPIMIMVPNRDFILWRLFGRNKKVLWGIDRNILNLSGWTKLWCQNNLRVEKVYRDEWLKQKHLIARILLPLIPMKYTYQYIFVLRQK